MLLQKGEKQPGGPVAAQLNSAKQTSNCRLQLYFQVIPVDAASWFGFFFKFYSSFELWFAEHQKVSGFEVRAYSGV